MQRRYKRYFIILELEDKNFKADVNKEIKGHAKVEVKNSKGTLSIYCQNLKSSVHGNRYRWYLINTNKEEAPTIVEIGPMEVDERGKGEIVCEFNTENIKGSMEKIDNFNVLVLAVQNKEDKSKLYTPLVGYIDKEKTTSWKYALSKHLYIPLEEEVKEEVKEDNKYKKDEEQKPLDDESIEQIVEETKKSIENIVIDVEEPINEEVKEEIKEEVKEEIEEEVKEEIKEEVKEEQHSTTVEIKIEEYEEQAQAYIENSLKSFDKVTPFINSLGNYIWWQIPYCPQTMYRAYMPFILYLDSLKETTSYYISKMLQTTYINKHHIFGICYNENNKAEYYAYGIRGTNTSLDQPFETDMVATYWYPSDSVATSVQNNGYWIILIDSKTGDVVKEKKHNFE